MIALKIPFNANSLPMLTLKIIKGNYAPPPQRYTADLRNLISQLLNVDPDKRPSVDQILKLPIIKNRIKNYLNEIDYNKEFSKSIVKLYKEKNHKLKKILKRKKSCRKMIIILIEHKLIMILLKKYFVILNLCELCVFHECVLLPNKFE